MDRPARLELCRRLAFALKRQQPSLLPHLRAYYAEVRDGRPHAQWSDAHVEDLCRSFRVPPFDTLPARARNCGCTDCGTRGKPFVVHVWDLGARVRCDTCGESWLELRNT